ncbi:imidazole glycerol phosphate synthase subunit HisF [Shewanella sp. NFH-SH190041]|uniref:imidazole glycerol phosphate synthase subunit HisF n=1 Tax=Shewanella sp. NFH-SH190041 TaxID=2950245 RepID=UPI0021C2B272|nr:imidazole glycerol phosphate synthase subunit HisF [Shewanella sp. NFH-SH190041]BDM64834.1 imidazole glycerol phosphate synthase subunit HisF [Shewanella sp. NFH-SH190041]
MLAKRIVPCLDVRDGKVVKGVQFRNHKVMGDILPLAQRYAQEGADELVFYDISASARGRLTDTSWIQRIAEQIDIPFCVAGGIRTVAQARAMLAAGADKISINSPALSEPELITRLQDEFGRQCIVVGIDSQFDPDTGSYRVKQFTGEQSATRTTNWYTQDWVEQVQQLGCGEIVLNVMDQDGMRQGYDIDQLSQIRQLCDVPLIASGGAGCAADFCRVFREAKVDAALAASIFHQGTLAIAELKQFLLQEGICVRPVTDTSLDTATH